MFVRCSNSTTTQLWNADMSTSWDHTKAFVRWCHGKHTVPISWALMVLHERTKTTKIWVFRDERKFTGRAPWYSKRGIPGMFPNLEETQGAMYKGWSSVLRTGPKWQHDLFELFVIFGDRPLAARPEAVRVCVCVGEGGGKGCLYWSEWMSGTEQQMKV